MNLVTGQEYRRAELHKAYGGQQQGGISTPKDHSVILLFTGSSGQQYGYHDGPQPDGTFWYTGEGQRGDMQWLRGNASIRDAESAGKVLHLFEETKKSWVRYLGEVNCIGYHETTGPDLDGKTRRVYVFELALDSAEASGQPGALLEPPEQDVAALWKLSLDQLRAAALQPPPKGAPKVERQRVVHRRSVAVKVYVRRRANGVCESCAAPAPFNTPKGLPYLEPHHIRRLADGGPDHPRWVAAICPNCHRRIHSGADGRAVNVALAQKIGEIEE